MRVELEPGKYVVAVSGGLDSVALLDMLAGQPDLELVVAHFDHGIRPDSADDAAFVATLAAGRQLPFFTERTELGPGASEAAARAARYDFLRRVQTAGGARAIVTAHHQDDALETAVINLLRGTGRRGLTALKDRPDLRRPLLSMTKQQLHDYALQRSLRWREDTTNHDERYTRNYIRLQLLAGISPEARQRLLDLLERQRAVNAELDEAIHIMLTQHLSEQGLDRRWFNSLPHDLSKELLAGWLRVQTPVDFDRPTLERLAVQAKTKAAGKQLEVGGGYRLRLSARHLALEAAER